MEVDVFPFLLFCSFVSGYWSSLVWFCFVLMVIILICLVHISIWLCLKMLCMEYIPM